MVRTLICFSLIFSLSAGAAEPAPAQSPRPKFNEPYFQVIGLTIICAGVGIPTCLLFYKSVEKKYTRPASVRGGDISYFPSYVVDSNHGAAYQRIEAHGYVSNLLVMAEHRRGFENFEQFQSTSVRAAYSFDYGDGMPAFGVGYRDTKGGINDHAVELWLPVYSNAKGLNMKGEEKKYVITLSTSWIFGNKKIRPEALLQIGQRLSKSLFINMAFGYFSDYPHPDIEIAVGPTVHF